MVKRRMMTACNAGADIGSAEAEYSFPERSNHPRITRMNMNVKNRRTGKNLMNIQQVAHSSSP